MRSAQRGAVGLRAAGAAATIAGLALLSVGTLSARAGAEDGPFSMSSTPGVTIVADGWSLSDVIVLTKNVGHVKPDTAGDTTTTATSSEGKSSHGTPKVSLFSGDCDNAKDTDESKDKDGKGIEEDELRKDAIGSDVVMNEDHNVWTATTEGVKVEKTGDYSFEVSWNGQSACEDVTVAKAVPTATPLPTATPTPVPTQTPVATTTSGVAAVTKVKVPSTGADLPFGLGGALLASGLGFLAIGARRRRSGREVPNSAREGGRAYARPPFLHL